MSSDLNTINKVELNVSSNKKKNKLELFIKTFFESKMQPYIDQKMEALEEGHLLNIDRIQLDLKPLNVVDVDSINEREENKLIIFFKEQFDLQFDKLVSRKKPYTSLQMLQDYLLKGYLLKNFTEFKVTDVLGNLSQKEILNLQNFFLVNKNRQNIFKRFFKLYEPDEIDKFIAVLYPNYSLSSSEIINLLIKNKSRFKFSKEQALELIQKYFLTTTIPQRSSQKKVVDTFIENRLGLNPEEIQQKGNKAWKDNIKERKTFTKELFKSYDIAINKLKKILKYQLENKQILNYDLEELFQDFIFSIQTENKSIDQIIDIFIESQKNKLYLKDEFYEEYSIDFISQQRHIIYYLESGSLPINLANYSQEKLLNDLMFLAKHQTFQLRNILVELPKTFFLKLMGKMDQNKLEHFINYFSSNFLYEKKLFFSYLKTQMDNQSVIVDDFNSLKNEFSSFFLRQIIDRKAINYEPSTLLFSKWLKEKKVRISPVFFKKQTFAIKKSNVVSQFIKTVKAPRVEPSNFSTDLRDMALPKENFSALFYHNFLTYYFLYNDFPWWGMIHFTDLGNKKQGLVLELISQFKNRHNLKFIEFLEQIKLSPILISNLIYKSNKQVFNFLVKDILSPNDIKLIKLFLKDLQLISRSLLGNELYITQLQNDLYYSILSLKDEYSLDSIFDQIFDDVLSISSFGINELIDSFSAIELSSSYFKNQDISYILFLLQNKKKEKVLKNISLFNYSEVQILEELTQYTRSGILIGILGDEEAIYLDFVKKVLKNKKIKDDFLNEILLSKFPSSYFLKSIALKKELNDKFLKDLEEQDIQKEKELNKAPLYYKSSGELNLAIFNYFILNDKFPWWAPFESLSEFQAQFIFSFNESRDAFIKELAKTFSNDGPKEKLLSFFHFNSDKFTDQEKFGNSLLKALETILNNSKEAFVQKQPIYSYLLSLKQLMHFAISIEDQIKLITAFLNYSMDYISWISKRESNQFVAQLVDLVKAANKRFNLTITIDPPLKVKKQSIENKQEILDQQISQQLINSQSTQPIFGEENVGLFSLIIKPLLKVDEYNYAQEILLELSKTYDPDQKSLDQQNEFSRKLLELFYRLLIESTSYTIDHLTEKLIANPRTKKIINQNWINQLKTEFTSMEKEQDQKLAKTAPILQEIEKALVEKYKADANIHFQLLIQLIALKDKTDKEEWNTTFLSFMHYLSIINQKDIKSLMLSFFRLKSISNTSTYDILLELNQEEIIEKFEKDNPELLVKLELQAFIKSLDFPVIISDSALSIMDSFVNLNKEKWSVSFLLFIIKKWAQKKDVSLSIAFDQIKEKVTKEKRFNHLQRVKKLLVDVEKNEYFILEEDTYSNVIKDIKALEDIESNLDNFVGELIRKIKDNNHFLEDYQTYNNGQLIEKNDFNFQNDTLLPEVKKGDQLQIYNAGLAIIWPFIGTLFAKLGYVKDKQFVDKTSQLRAVHLLQYIVDGGEASPEFVLVFNKLICGIPLSDPLDMFVMLAEEEKSEADQFLESIKSKWKEMKNTSVDTFRESFLKREGTLTFDEKNWKLNVESKPIDVLLKKLPWGISLIKFHWIDYIIYVEWTTKN